MYNQIQHHVAVKLQEVENFQRAAWKSSHFLYTFLELSSGMEVPRPLSKMEQNRMGVNSPMQSHAVPCSPMQSHAIPCSPMQSHAIPCNPMPSFPSFHSFPSCTHCSPTNAIRLICHICSPHLPHLPHLPTLFASYFVL